MSMLIEAIPVPLVVDAQGAVRIGKTRVLLDTVVEAFKQGATAEEIAQDYSILDLAQVYAVIGYYLNHVDEVERYLSERRQDAEALRTQIERRFDPNGVRDRLLARKSAKTKQ
jgi:uncharacterized protein (DUF433 family)